MALLNLEALVGLVELPLEDALVDGVDDQVLQLPDVRQAQALQQTRPTINQN